MPHNVVGAPCSDCACPSGCSVTLVAHYVCDFAITPASLGVVCTVYSSHDGSCSGSVLLTTWGDLSSLPDGSYDVHISESVWPTVGGIVTKARCKTITIDRAECVGDLLTFHVNVEPKYYNVAVRIGAVCGELQTADVRVHDGVNDVTLHTSDGLPYFYFHGLTVPPDGSTLTVEVDGLDYCNLEPYSYTLVLDLDPDDPAHYTLCAACSIAGYVGASPAVCFDNALASPATGYAWYGGCQCPGPANCTYTDDTGTKLLTPVYSSPGVLDYWEGCITLGGQAIEWKNPASACPDGPIPIGGKYALSGSPALGYVRVTPHGTCSPMGVWYTVSKDVPVGYYYDCDDLGCPPSGNFAAVKQPDISGTPVLVTCATGAGGGLHAISGGTDYVAYWSAGGDTDLYDCGEVVTGSLGTCPSADPCQDVASLCGDYTLTFA